MERWPRLIILALFWGYNTSYSSRICTLPHSTKEISPNLVKNAIMYPALIFSSSSISANNADMRIIVMWSWWAGGVAMTLKLGALGLCLSLRSGMTIISWPYYGKGLCWAMDKRTIENSGVKVLISGLQWFRGCLTCFFGSPAYLGNIWVTFIILVLSCPCDQWTSEGISSIL